MHDKLSSTLSFQPVCNWLLKSSKDEEEVIIVTSVKSKRAANLGQHYSCWHSNTTRLVYCASVLTDVCNLEESFLIISQPGQFPQCLVCSIIIMGFNLISLGLYVPCNMLPSMYINVAWSKVCSSLFLLWSLSFISSQQIEEWKRSSLENNPITSAPQENIKNVYYFMILAFKLGHYNPVKKILILLIL